MANSSGGETMSSAKHNFTISSDNLAYFAVGLPTSAAAQGVEEKEPFNRAHQTSAETKGWSALIDDQLASWARDPAQLEDDGLEAPSRSTIAKASSVAASLRDIGAPLPTRIVPTGDGGIALQFERGRQFISIEVEPEGLVELMVFDGGRLAHRAAL